MSMPSARLKTVPVINGDHRAYDDGCCDGSERDLST